MRFHGVFGGCSQCRATWCNTFREVLHGIGGGLPVSPCNIVEPFSGNVARRPAGVSTGFVGGRMFDHEGHEGNGRAPHVSRTMPRSRRRSGGDRRGKRSGEHTSEQPPITGLAVAGSRTRKKT